MLVWGEQAILKSQNGDGWGAVFPEWGGGSVPGSLGASCDGWSKHRTRGP